MICHERNTGATTGKSALHFLYSMIEMECQGFKDELAQETW
jgi:hypothetical protein